MLLRDLTDTTQEGGSRLHQGLTSALARGLPRHVRVLESGEAAEWELAVALGPTRRQFDGELVMRKQGVHAYDFDKPNPAWEEAAEAYNDAIRDCGDAREQYQIWHNGAQQQAQNASNGGVAGLFAAVASTGEETAGIATVVSAQNKLRDASQRLQSTPAFVRQRVDGTIAYPVQTFRAHAEARLAWRLAGPSRKLEDSATLAANARAERVTEVRELGVAAADTGVDALATLAPDYARAGQELGKSLAESVAVAEEERLFRDFERSEAGRARAVAAACYVYAGQENGRREAALAYLVWMLP